MKKYTVMGSHPGDGGVVFAKSPREAAIKFLSQSYGSTQKEVREDFKKHKVVGKKLYDGAYLFGDYEVKDIEKLGVYSCIR